MKTFLIKTLGCKVNSYESEFIRTIMLNDGYEEVNENADICIVNTCTVTNTADNKSKQVINNIRKNIGPAVEYDDEGNIISWNGKSTVSEPMSEEEIKELEALINEITKGDE